MVDRLIQTQALNSIANTINTKNGTSNTIAITLFASSIT